MFKTRQLSLLSNPSTLQQEDCLLCVILDKLCPQSSEEENRYRPQRCTRQAPPEVGIASFRSLIRFLSGMGDFGRVNADQP